jgi:hypothetical protein
VIVEVPVEKIVERVVNKPIDRIVEKIVEKPVEVIKEVEKLVQVEVPVIREDTAKIDQLSKDNAALKGRIRDLEKEVSVQPKIVEKIVEVEKEVPVEVERAATKDLREAARLMARSELNKEDLSEEDIFSLLQKASEADVRKRLGFWAVPLPKSDETDTTNKRYIGKK